MNYFLHDIICTVGNYQFNLLKDLSANLKYHGHTYGILSLC